MTTTSAARPRQPGRLRSLFGFLVLARGKPGEIVIVSHSNLFYWWPVWVTGFLLAAYTYFWDDNRLAIVPPGTAAAKERRVEVEPGKIELRDVLILPSGKHLVDQPAAFVLGVYHRLWRIEGFWMFKHDPQARPSTTAPASRTGGSDRGCASRHHATSTSAATATSSTPSIRAPARRIWPPFRSSLSGCFGFLFLRA